MIPQHLSESTEHYTPAYIVGAARRTFGEIDLDPASSKEANHLIKAKKIFTRQDNGLKKTWHGRIFLNPPGGLCDDQGRKVIRGSAHRLPCTQSGACGLEPGHTHKRVTSSAKKWWEKLAREYVQGRVKSAIFIGFSIEVLQTTQDLLEDPELFVPAECPLCIPKSRIPFDKWTSKGRVSQKQPAHANVIIFLPEMGDDLFEENFKEIGCILNTSGRQPARMS